MVECKHSAVSRQPSAIPLAHAKGMADVTEIKPMLTCFIQKHIK
ncbi:MULTISPECIES: hypothetical protein [Moorena]|nr:MULTISPECIES: hypothetical protein [Moorena]